MFPRFFWTRFRSCVGKSEISLSRIQAIKYVYLCAHYSSENEYEGVFCHGTSSLDVVVFRLKIIATPILVSFILSFCSIAEQGLC
jgi:hypothetical protein